jgi:hypothetical protein
MHIKAEVSCNRKPVMSSELSITPTAQGRDDAHGSRAPVDSLTAEDQAAEEVGRRPRMSLPGISSCLCPAGH